MSPNDNKGRRHASIYLGDPPVSYGGGDCHSGDRGLCLMAHRGIRRRPEMVAIAHSTQGPQGSIAQARPASVPGGWRLTGASPAANSVRLHDARDSCAHRATTGRLEAARSTRRQRVPAQLRIDGQLCRGSAVLRRNCASDLPAGRARSLTLASPCGPRCSVCSHLRGATSALIARVAAPASRRHLVSALDAAPRRVREVQPSSVHADIITVPPF